MRPIYSTKICDYAAALDTLERDGRLRGLNLRKGVGFVSNDYLALASAPRMKKAISVALEASTPVGAGGSRLLRGNCEEYEAFEAEAARFFCVRKRCCSLAAAISEISRS